MSVNIGIIGLGWFANIIAKSISESGEDICIKAISDINPEKRNKFVEKFNVKKEYTDSSDLLGDPEVEIVIIATPPTFHFRLGEQALFSGKHVFFEKPGALTPNEMEQLIKIAANRNLKTTIDYVMRRNPLYFILKRFYDSKALGLLERAYLENYAHDDHMPPEHWFWDYTKSGGIWVEHGVHFFDIVNWLMGSPEKVKAINLARKGEDIIDRVLGLALHGDTTVSYYHGFTKPEVFEKTTFHFIFERAYIKILGWVPIKMYIDTLITSETRHFIEEELLIEAEKFLPGIDIELSGEKIEKYRPGEDIFMGRGKKFKAGSRTHFEYTIKQGRWEVYRKSVMEGIKDLIKAVEGKKDNPDVTLLDALKSLEVASLMEKSSGK